MTAIHPFHIEVHETDFDIARDLADFASRIDDIKQKFNPELRALATVCAEKMHHLAEVMAGDRAGEIYSPDDGSETPRRDTEEGGRL